MADYHFEYDAAAKVVAVRVTGIFTDGVFRSCYADMSRHAAGRDVSGAIMDLSNVERFDVSAATIRQVSALPAAFPDPMLRYVVATQDHIFGMARMFQMVSPRGRDMLHIVRSMQDAYDALGVSSPQFERLPDLP